MKVKRMNLYLVETGKPEKPGWITFSSVDTAFYVIAENHAMAFQKGQEYLSSNEISLVAEDGSLKPTDDLQVKNIKIVADKLIY